MKEQQERKFRAVIKGGFAMAVDQPLQLQVFSADVNPEPFWAFTPEAVQRSVPEGVRLKGGIVIPWDSMRVGRQVLIRELDIAGTLRPFIVVQSLLKRRFFK